MSRRRGETYIQWLDRTDAQAAALEASTNYVYRAFDSYGLLLYIGCSVNVKNRMNGHRSGPWHRYAETIAIVAHPSRSAALAAERIAIDTEGAYFNAMVSDINRTNANRTAAQRRVCARGISAPDFDLERYEAGDAEYLAQHDAEQDLWDRSVEREKALLKATSHPYLTDADRLARYRAAREDAELARQEQAA